MGFFVGEGQELHHDYAGPLFLRIDPKVGVRHSGPSQAPGGTAAIVTSGVDEKAKAETIP